MRIALAARVRVFGLAVVMALLGCEGTLEAGPRTGPSIVDGGSDTGVVIPDASVGPSDMCGDTRAAAIHNGTSTPTELPLDAKQVLSIVMITFNGSLCSGTVIHPRYVLTAKHCTEGESSAEVHIGSDPSNPDVTIQSTRLIDNPSVDMALIELSEDATARVPGLVPIRINVATLDQSWIGRNAETSGYGQDSSGQTGTRFFAVEPVYAVEPEMLAVNGNGVRGVCFGDSGGPVMLLAADGSVRVAGDLSGGDESCVGVDRFTRTDVQKSWIEGYTGATPDTDAMVGCGSVTTAGECRGNIAVYCAAGEVRMETCSASCGYDSAQQGYRCITQSDPCGGLTLEGACSGNVAQWCDRGVVRSRDCGQCGQVCGASPEHGGAAYCITSGCGTVTYQGQCSGTVSTWCEDGSLRSKDCAADGKTCGFVNADVGYYCQ